MLEEKAGSSESIIAPGTRIKGTITESISIRISGHFEGRINSEGLVKIGEGGKIEGTINSPYVIIEGEMNGDIESADHVELRSKARMIGKINTINIVITEGSFYKGEIKTSRREDKPIIFVDKRKSEERDISEEKSD